MVELEERTFSIYYLFVFAGICIALLFGLSGCSYKTDKLIANQGDFAKSDSMYDGPLPFSGLSRPLSQMKDNGDGTVTSEDGVRMALDEVFVSFKNGFSEDSMNQSLSEAGFVVTYSYWHEKLDAGDAIVKVPEDMTPEIAGEELLKIDGVDAVTPVNRPKEDVKLFESAHKANID